MLNITKLLGEIGVAHWTYGKNVQEGWTSVSCPHCGDRSNHGAFSPTGTAYSCFKCGRHSVRETVAKYVTWEEAGRLITEHSSSLNFCNTQEKLRAGSVAWPPEGACKDMPEAHAQYLIDRGYNPQQIEELYGISSMYHTGDFKYRILIPIFENGRVVTYVGRDITGKAPLRYKNLSSSRSIKQAKEVIYNLDSVHETAIVCEGITDAWRFGVHGVATCGLVTTQAQIDALAKRIKHAFICFDSEPQAQKQARLLGEALAYQGTKVEILSIDASDPGELSAEEADEIRREVFS